MQRRGRGDPKGVHSASSEALACLRVRQHSTLCMTSVFSRFQSKHISICKFSDRNRLELATEIASVLQSMLCLWSCSQSFVHDARRRQQQHEQKSGKTKINIHIDNPITVPAARHHSNSCQYLRSACGVMIVQGEKVCSQGTRQARPKLRRGLV